MTTMSAAAASSLDEVTCNEEGNLNPGKRRLFSLERLHLAGFFIRTRPKQNVGAVAGEDCGQGRAPARRPDYGRSGSHSRHALSTGPGTGLDDVHFIAQPALLAIEDPPYVLTVFQQHDTGVPTAVYKMYVGDETPSTRSGAR